VAQYNDSSNLTADNGDSRQSVGTLIPREQELAAYAAMGAPMLAPMWSDQAVSGISLTKIWHSFRRRWLLALFIGLMMGIPAALATWLIFPKQFEVQAMLQFRNREDWLGDRGPVNTEANKQWRESQLVMIRSALMLQRAIGEPRVGSLSMILNESEPIYFLQKYISVYSPKDSNLVLIRMTGEDPKQMVEIVRALTDKYVDYAKSEASTERGKQLDMLQRQYDGEAVQLRKKIEARTTLIKKLAVIDSESAKAKMSDLSQEMYHLRSKLSDRESRLSQALLDLARLEERQRTIEEGRYPEALLNDEIKKDPEMIELQRDVAKAQKLYRAARSVAKYPQTDPAVQRAAETVKSLQEEVEKLAAELREIALAKLKWGKDRPEESLPVTQARVESLQQEVDGIQEKILALKNEYDHFTGDSAELAQQNADIQRLEATTAELNRRLIEARLRVNLQPPVDVIEPAEEPEGSAMLYRVILTTFLGLLCFSVGVAGVVLVEYTKQRVSTLNDVGYGGLGIRVLGTVPNLARITSKTKSPEAGAAVAGILAESIDSVRTMLLSNKRADAPKVILVTSADEHEGKTTVASHLAASLARAGRRTLLVDGDLRKPSIHMLFDMPLSSGVCEVLRGEAEIEAVVHPAQVEGMWVMLAGRYDQAAIAALAKETASALFRTLRADYDFVVVDTGPALAFADTMLMGSHADAAVMSILRDVSQIPKVYEARERLEAIGVMVLGGVVGGVANSGSRNYSVVS
jgi:capsular exopolysaccharide synthesis family protein